MFRDKKMWRIPRCRWPVKVGAVAGIFGMALSLYAFLFRFYEDLAASDTPGLLYLMASIVQSVLMGAILFLFAWGLCILIAWLIQQANGKSPLSPNGEEQKL